MSAIADLSGKTALVTGAGRGLGRAISLGLASAGAQLAAAARSADELAETVALIEEIGGKARAFSFDAAERTSSEGLIADVVATFGKLDIAAINHGIGFGSPAEKTKPEDFERTLAVNLTGAFNVAQLSGRQMIKQGHGGSIIFTSSTGSFLAFNGLLAYGASKGGVDQMTRQLALEWGKHNIRVNAVNPGYTTHQMRTSGQPGPHDYEFEDSIKALTPLGRRGESQEFAGPVVFLASDAASFITGVCLPVDGGYSAV